MFNKNVTIKSVSENNDCFMISTTDSGGFNLEKKYGVVPVPGDTIKLYFVNGFGTPIRGMDLNGKSIYYKSNSQLEQERREWLDDYNKEKQEEFERNKIQLDADYESLPDVFKQRIDRFRKNNPNFRVDYESYELFCCKEAIKIANACETLTNIKKFKNGFSELVPTLSEGHSGNTFDCACYLARIYLESPDLLWKTPGAMSPLVGSKEYGG